ncbi:nickel transporter, partial [Streptomyces sp. NPDC059597]
LGPRTVFALPPAEADRAPEAPAAAPVPAPVPAPGSEGQHDSVPVDQSDDHTPPQPHPTTAPTGRRRRAVAQPSEPTREAQGVAQVAPQAQPGAVPAPGMAPVPGQQGAVPGPPAVAGPVAPVPGQAVPASGQPGAPVGQAVAVAGQPAPVPGQAVPVPAQAVPVPAQAVPVPGQPVAVPGQPVAAPGQPVPVPGQGTAVPGQAVPVTGQAVPVAGPPVQVPGQTVAVAGQAPAVAVPTPGQPVPAPGQPLPVPGQVAPVAAQQPAPIPAQGMPVAGQPVPGAAIPAQAPAPAEAPPQGTPQPGAQPLPVEAAHTTPVPQPWPDDDEDDTAGAGVPAPQASALPPRAAQPLPAEAPGAPAYDPTSTQGQGFSVRTLGQGVPFVRQAAQVQQAQQAPQPGATPPPHGTNGGGRRRKLGTPPAARPEAQPEQPGKPHAAAEPSLAGQTRLAPGTEGIGRSYAIGAPDANAAEGPEPLDGPGGAVEVADTPRPQPLDDELPPEPLDNPRRLLVWPAPDTMTEQALSDRGYRPVVVHSREEVDAQIAAFPAALFVDPLTGPITRTALQSLRQAAVAAEVPVLVTAGLGQASREAAYGADPAVLLKALAPRDSEQHPPRVLLVEEHAEIALALTATLERRGMQVARAASDGDAVTLAGQFRPNLVVMDLMQMQRQQAGIVDWLRTNGQLTRTPLVVYTATVDPGDLPRLASGESVLFLAERATTDEAQSRIVDLLARIGTN